MRFIATILLSTTTAAFADTRSELDAVLAAFTGRDHVRAMIHLELIQSNGDAKQPEASSGQAAVAAKSSEGVLELTWSAEQVATASSADQENSPDRRAMDELSVSRLTHYLNAAPQLMEALKDAEVISERPDVWQGFPARVVAFRLNPKLSDKDRKYIKELDATATLWLAPDGTPVAADRSVRVKGRAMLVIGFESSETEHYEFIRLGDRLVVTQHIHEARGSGAGESSQRRSVARLTIDAPTA